MCKLKDYVEQHPFDKFPVDVPKVDEDNRLDYQQQREEEVSSSMDSYFAPSQGY
jgi:hypothetical protein